MTEADTKERFRDIDKIFHPRSVVVIGVTASRGFWWLRSLSTFKGELYAVNPSHVGKIPELDVECYASVLDVPEPLDYAVIAIPADMVPDAVEKCGEKRVKVVSIFTSGFSELNTEKGFDRERTLVEAARKGGVRMIGPNCMGIYCPSMGLRFRIDQPTESGSVGFISQSGGHAINVTTVGPRDGVYFSKVISYGNGCDLDSPDFIEYLAYDDETSIIGMYIEGVRDGKRFMRALTEAAHRKPVLILKGGQTEEGGRATSSHTGSMAGSSQIWKAAVRQCGAVMVSDFEELTDILMAFYHSPKPHGKRIGMLSISGGQSVVLTDGCVKAGLEVPQLSEESKEQISSLIFSVGTNPSNPVDVASSWHDAKSVEKVIEVIDSDPNIDALLVEIAVHYDSQHILHIMSRKEYSTPTYSKLTRMFRIAKKNISKPLFIVLSPTYHEDGSLELRKKLIGLGLPVYPNIGRAARALINMLEYYERHTPDTKEDRL